MSGVKINPKMLNLAREAKQLSHEQLSEALHTSRVNVTRWELGQQYVNEEMFALLPKVLKFTAEFFMQEGEPQPPVFYRKRLNVSGKIMSALDANMNIFRLQISKLLKFFQFEPADIPTLPLAKVETPEKAAQQLRKAWKIEKGPIFHLSEVIEKHRIIIAPIDFGTERVDGRTMLTNDGHPIVFVNKTQPGDRLRFTLAFELGHLVMHTTGANSYNEKSSHEANLFAAEFLMPEKDIRTDLESERITIPRLAELKKKWRVSMISLMYRANSLGIIDDNQKQYLLKQFNQLKIRRREPQELDVLFEKPALLKNLLVQFRQKKRYTVKELATFLCLSEEEYVRRYVE